MLENTNQKENPYLRTFNAVQFPKTKTRKEQKQKLDNQIQKL